MDQNLTVVVFGNSAAVQYGDDNMLLGKEVHFENAETPKIDTVQVKISARRVSVTNIIGLHETEHQSDSLDHLIGQLVNENEIHAFIFVVPLGQLTDADKMGIEWLQEVFGDRVTEFAIILFTYEQQEESESIIDDLKNNIVLEQLYEKCGSRYYTCNKIMNNQSELSTLMIGIEHLLFDNKQQGYTREMYNTLKEEIKKRGGQKTRNLKMNQPTTINEECHGVLHAISREIPRGMVKMCLTDSAGTNQNKGCEVREKIEQLFQRLHLNNRQDCKLRAADVLQLTAHSLESHESCTEKELVQTYIQKLLMMNYRARNIEMKDTNNQQNDNDPLEDKGNVDVLDELFMSTEIINKTNNTGAIHPMDVQMAVFHCAENFLKQLMVTKLSQCQYALPLLVPDPFTKQIQFPLWSFRQISKGLKMTNKNNEIIRKIQSVYKAETPMVFFFRFDTLSSSKSQLINSLINEKHNTFFHRHCSGSSKTRLLLDGVVEIAWYSPSGKDTDTFTDCVAFCNLHGDAEDNEKQLEILTQMASVNVVFLPKLDKNVKGVTRIPNLSRKPLICLFGEDESSKSKTRSGIYKIGLKGRNQADVSKELRVAIKDFLSMSPSESTSLFKLEDVSKHIDRVDEDEDESCKKGKAAAENIMRLLREESLTKIKENLLPSQGTLWHNWCQKIKELHQGYVIETDLPKKQVELKTIRVQQHERGISQFVKLFIQEMISKTPEENLFFLKWLPILLDEYTSTELSELHYKYDKKWSEVLKRKDNAKRDGQPTSTIASDEETELDEIAKELQAATFGLEHIVREIGQIYESCSSVNKEKKGLPCKYSVLPRLAAEMMVSGFPLELMDGDAAHVPFLWITAVLDELITVLGDQRVFVLSVLGVQSSGKSTMLNAMFGLQFAVSAGRCTRGAFMQLVKVSEEMRKELKFDYILVVDTEGLRAPELAGRSTRHHDNVMATFVVGLGNLTLINIFGENPSEMQDTLQIVVQAFLRMKQVKQTPSCIFVHQNVSDNTAGEKNKEGRRRLQETLDKMTKLAAKDEVCNVECFSEVITFDVQKDVKYFAQLWEGSPPMAPPNPSYCENIKELKKTFLCNASTSDGIMLTCIKDRIKDLWEALLNERFVFSFRNSLEIATYRKLETAYSKWSWSLRSTMLEIESKLHNRIENEAIDEVEATVLQGQLQEKSTKVKQSMSEFFEKDKDRDILIQWQVSFEIKIKEVEENIVRETKRKLNDIIQQRDLKRKIDSHKTNHENTLFEKSKELAIKLKDKANDKAILKREFDSFWKECLKTITTNTPSIKDIDILGDMQQLYNDIYKSSPVDAWKEDGRNKNIFKVPSYSSYVQLKKSTGITENFVNVCKKTFGCTLSKEDVNQIRNLVNDIADQTEKKIMSYNIPKMGYNKSYIQELADYIKARVIQYEESCVKYTFKNEFYLDLLQSISKTQNKTFREQHKMFRESHDPVFYFEKKRREYYSIFQKYCQGATSAAIFGVFICQKLKEPIEKSVYKNTARYLANEMKTNCEPLNGNRSKLEKHILKRLAENEDFDKYIEYIYEPKKHFKNFINEVVEDYISAKFRTSVLPKMKENTEVLQQNIMKAAHKATEISKDIDEWLKHFTQELSDVLIFSVKDFSGVRQDGIDDFNILEDVIRKELPSITAIISSCSREKFPAKLENKDRPYEILIEHLCQCCWVQCPFCAAICTNSIENHDEDHSVPFHRVDGLNGCCYDFTEGLGADFCTTLVTTNKKFYVGQWTPCKEYRIAGGVYAKWSITPDLSELPYWKWFVCNFQEQLENYYERKFHSWEISYEWKQYTKVDAIKSLDKYI
ncbi:Interferon-induced very large GTPase 1 [Triplophysa tibetana]|uniref:Interferon-induced very large GTPase 1 n=1 Tax=Triplophysa tibetana TaxID=1572043 RepID=A0A5A9NND2_9TELE|nr:Interferon-induced very large GTPase 1 [Triplophysa tibetana]